MAAQLYHMEINYLKLLRSFVSDNLLYSDGKNLKHNIYENTAYFFDNFHRIREANQKSVNKSAGSKTSISSQDLAASVSHHIIVVNNINKFYSIQYTYKEKVSLIMVINSCIFIIKK